MESNIVIIRGEVLVGKTYLVKHYLTKNTFVSNQKSTRFKSEEDRNHTAAGIYCELEYSDNSLVGIANQLAFGNNEFQGLLNYLDTATERRELTIQLSKFMVSKHLRTNEDHEYLSANDLALLQVIHQIIGKILIRYEKLVICLDNLEHVSSAKLLKKFIDMVTHANVQWILVAKKQVSATALDYFEIESPTIPVIHIDRMSPSEAEILWQHHFTSLGSNIQWTSEAMTQIHLLSGNFPYLINFIGAAISSCVSKESQTLFGTTELQNALQKIAHGEFTGMYERMFEYAMASEDGSRCMMAFANNADVNGLSRIEISPNAIDLPPGWLLREGNQRYIITFPQMQLYARLRLGIHLTN